ncbi:MAG: hypothetical protein KDA61_03995, partial [Planctomycetales bacterium]|nr:hypothetical protein [Planctomycetales bacterium]
MLYQDDRHVIAADRQLPGLELLLNNDAALDLFAESSATRHLLPMRVVCNYLRYKPGENCLGAYTLFTPEGRRYAALRTYGASGADKLEKAASWTSPLSAELRPDVCRRWQTAVWPFPLDSRLKALPELADVETRDALLARIAAHRPEWQGASLECLRFKPLRRFVGRLHRDGAALACVKMHTAHRYEQIRRTSKVASHWSCAAATQVIARSSRRRLLVTDWIDGAPLVEFLDDSNAAQQWGPSLGAVLAELHANSTSRLPHRDAVDHLREVRRVVDDLAAWAPALGALAEAALRGAAEFAVPSQAKLVNTHGDLHAGQFLLADHPILIDFDNVRLSLRESDLGNLFAHLHAAELQREIERDEAIAWRELIVAGYEEASHVHLNRARLDAYTALGLLRLSPEPFRTRCPHWRRRTRQLLERASEIGDSSRRTSVAPASPLTTPPNSPARPTAFAAPAASADSTSPRGFELVAQALDRNLIDNQVLPLAAAAFADDSLEPVDARIVREKPGRRWLIAYDFRSGRRGCEHRVLGKIHVKPRHLEAFLRQRELWSAGFDEASHDKISTPR